jgi:hypothetical protein
MGLLFLGKNLHNIAIVSLDLFSLTGSTHFYST